MYLKCPDWFDEWVEVLDEYDFELGSCYRLKKDAPEEIKIEFKKFMEKK